MLFNSVDFAIFLPIVFAIYWIVGGKRVHGQNTVLLAASYVFYAWWDWRFLSLLLISTLVDYWVGATLHKTEGKSKRKQLLWLSICVNIGLLGFFKYYNFFAESFTDSFRFFGGELNDVTLQIILPVGISFYTFQTLTYTIDIYRKQLQPTRNFVAFATFVAFFPQLVIGPIERASRMIPQFISRRSFKKENAIIGIKQIVWGLFKKIVIADGCAQYVNEIFGNHESYSGTTLILGAIYFTFQVYADFSGYSDIAIGTARLFDIKLMTNFKYPLFARNIADFWRNWHISLTTWFRDYVYFPLGGSRGSSLKVIRNIFIVFLISGLWHGANWTFIVFGAYHAMLYTFVYLFQLRNKHSISEGGVFPKFKVLIQISITFVLVAIGMVFFRATDVMMAFSYLQKMFINGFGLDLLTIQRYSFEMLPLIGLLVGIEWFSRKKEFPLSSPRWSILQVSLVIGMIIFFGSFSNPQDFIYFRF